MRNIDDSPWLSNPQLQIIQKDSKQKANANEDERSFILNAVQVSQIEEKKK
jgi:hypothetical protein